MTALTKLVVRFSYLRRLCKAESENLYAQTIVANEVGGFVFAAVQRAPGVEVAARYVSATGLCSFQTDSATTE
jgi:hypothetical protein